MQVCHLFGTILERHLNENARAKADNLQSITDYNIMMGILEDPAEEEEEVQADA